MAKEEKKANVAPEVIGEVTVENIREQLGKGSIGTLELQGKIAEDLAKEKNDRVVYETKRRVQKARYQVFKGLLNLRRERDINDIQHEELSQKDRLARFLIGFKFDCKDVKFRHASKLKDIFEKETIDFEKKTLELVMPDGKKKTFKDGDMVPPVISYVAYDELGKKIKEDTDKKMAEAEKQYKTDLKNLDAEFGEYYECSWRY